MTRPQTAIHEPSAWLRAAVHDRTQQLPPLPAGETGFAYLHPGPHTPDYDRRCDRCGTHVPPGPLFFTDVITAGPRLRLIVGLCQACRDLEVGQR